MTSLSEKLTNRSHAFGHVGGHLHLGKPHNGPTHRRKVVVAHGVTLSVVPVSPVNLNGQAMRRNRKIDPVSPNVMLRHEGDSGIREGDSHRSLNASLMSLLANDVTHMLLGVLGVIATQTLGMFGIGLASPRSRNGFNLSSESGVVRRFLAAVVSPAQFETVALRLVERLDPFVFIGSVPNVGARERAIVSGFEVADFNGELESADITRSSALGFSGPVVARARAVSPSTLRNTCRLHCEGGSTDLAYSRNASGATFGGHVLSLLHRLGAVVPGVLPHRPASPILPKPTVSCRFLAIGGAA